MAMTTIKLDAAVRDRLNAEARKRGITAGSLVEELLEVWSREQRFAAIAQAIEQTPDDLLESYKVESAAFEAVAGEQLDDAPPSAER